MAVANKSSPTKSKELLRVPLSRVRTIMKSSPDVENISQDSLFAIAKATELFIQHLAAESLKKCDGPELTYDHLAELVQTESSLEFIREMIPRKITFKEYKDIMRKRGRPVCEESSTEEEEDEAKSSDGGSGDGGNNDNAADGDDDEDEESESN